jgi:hypothetical protein
MKRFYTALIPALAVAVLLLILCGGCSTDSLRTEARAAIIDQLYVLKPDQTFISRISELLEDYGFKIDIYQGDEVTVDLYRKLPGYGYKLIIFRVHSGLLVKEEEMAAGTWLFTNEPHSQIKYTVERLTKRILKARTHEDQPWVFAIGSEFVRQDMEGQFDGTVIITMGCYSLQRSDLAEAFIQKGAGTYLGWDGNITLEYVDEATINLIENLCRNSMNIKQAITSTVAEIGPEPVYDTQFACYPASSVEKTLAQLIK